MRFEFDNKESILAGGHVEIARTEGATVSPEEAFRAQVRADNDSVDDNTRSNREHAATLPALRAEIIRNVARNGGAFTDAEIPR